MVVEVSTGNGFRSTISYVYKEHEKDLPQDKKPEVIEKNLVFGNTPEMARQMRFVSNANSRMSKPVMHVSVSFDAKECISEEQRQKAVQSVLKEIGVKAQDHQYLIVKHNDTANPHYHIVLNKVDLDGKKLNLGFDGKKEEFIKNRLQVIADKIEQEQGLKRTQGRNIVYDANNEKGYRFLSKEEKNEQKARNKKEIQEKNPNKREQQTVIKNEVVKVLQDKKISTADDFKKALESKGIDVRFSENKDGISGVSFKTDKISVKGSQIGVKGGYISKVLTTKAILSKGSEFMAYIKQNTPQTGSPASIVDQAIREKMKEIDPNCNSWETWNKNSQSEKLYQYFEDYAQKVQKEKQGIEIKSNMEQKTFSRHDIGVELEQALKNSNNVNLHDLKKDLESKGMYVHLSKSGPERENDKHIFNIKINEYNTRDLDTDINSVKNRLQENKNNLVKECFYDEKNTSILKLKGDLESKGFKVDIDVNPLNDKTAIYLRINNVELSPIEMMRVNKLINLNNRIEENKPIDNFDKQGFRSPSDHEQQENKMFQRINEYRGAVIQEYNTTMIETKEALKRNPNISLEEYHIDKFFESKGYLADKESDRYILRNEGKTLDEIGRSDFTDQVSEVNAIKTKYIQDLESYNKLQNQQREKVPFFLGRKDIIERNKELERAKNDSQKPIFNIELKLVDQGKYIKDSSYEKEKGLFQNLMESEIEKSKNAEKFLAEKKEILKQLDPKKAPQKQNKYTLDR